MYNVPEWYAAAFFGCDRYLHGLSDVAGAGSFLNPMLGCMGENKRRSGGLERRLCCIGSAIGQSHIMLSCRSSSSKVPRGIFWIFGGNVCHIGGRADENKIDNLNNWRHLMNSAINTEIPILWQNFRQYSR